MREGYRMRVYVPFGTQWYPYLMRRLAERPANVAFITGNVLREALAAAAAERRAPECPGSISPPITRGDANTIGGYMAVHGRPAAFEGTDGLSYSVEIVTAPTGRRGAAVGRVPPLRAVGADRSGDAERPPRDGLPRRGRHGGGRARRRRRAAARRRAVGAARADRRARAAARRRGGGGMRCATSATSPARTAPRMTAHRRGVVHGGGAGSS